MCVYEEEGEEKSVEEEEGDEKRGRGVRGRIWYMEESWRRGRNSRCVGEKVGREVRVRSVREKEEEEMNTRDDERLE